MTYLLKYGFCGALHEAIAVPDDLIRETGVDCVDLLLQNRAGLCLDLLHLLQPPAGHKEAASPAVVWQHLRQVGPAGLRWWLVSSTTLT